MLSIEVMEVDLGIPPVGGGGGPILDLGGGGNIGPIIPGPSIVVGEDVLGSSRGADTGLGG